MFSICPKKVYANSQITGTDLRVYLILQGYADERGFCFPSVAKIADICGVSRRTVFRSLKTLEQFGAIVREKRIREAGGFTSNAFYLNLEPERENDVTNLSRGECQKCHGGSDINVTPNKNQINHNVFLNTNSARNACAREKDSWLSEPVTVSPADINDVLSFVEKHTRAYEDYDFFLTTGSYLRARPKSSIRTDIELENEMLKFFSFRDFSICLFNDRYLNEVPVILEGLV